VFLDEARIEVKAGNGGNGCVAFRREKFVPRGGPSGGNGGRGGDVVLVADPGMNTLHAFRFTRRYAAGRGGHGGGSDKRGADGEILRVRVPVGTLVRDESDGSIVVDLVEPGEEAVVARGGRGGRGNAAFKGPTRQAPRLAERGEPGEERVLLLELKLLADVGIIGLPNAGKSTLLAAVSAARPKIADYPFTTLTPSLGVAEVGDRTLVLADIPGLIEGASTGHGLGDRFLRHIERTRLLAHVVDGSREDPVDDWRVVNGELAAFDVPLDGRAQLVVVNKVDLPDVRRRLPRLRSAFRAAGCPEVAEISAATGEGVAELVARLLAAVDALPPLERPAAQLPVIRPVEEDESFACLADGPGRFVVTGRRVERAAAMTDWSNDEGVARFQRIIDAMGVTEALRAQGAKEGDVVVIGDAELEWTD
jgi:GTP-binding protein